MARNNRKGGAMTVADAGRKGGEATAARHGHDFYQEIGRKGGKSRGKNRNQNNDGKSGSGQDK